MEAKKTILTNARIFTGKDWIKNGTVEITGDRISAVHETSISTSEGGRDCKGLMLVPAFLDLQIYGAGGKLFAAYPTQESLKLLADENRKDGTSTCLATIATQPKEVIYQSVEAVKNYLKEGGKGILGMHLEGPFLNAVKKGAHQASLIHAPTFEEVEELLLFADGAIKMATVAPEVCDPKIISLFIEAGVVVSAGHSNANYEQAMQFPSLGVKVATHLFNAMSPLHHRDTGIPGAVFENKQLRASIIPDGIHVSYSALRIAYQQARGRLYFITDAVTETSIGYYHHQLRGDHYCTPDGTLSGSAISMLQGVKNAVRHAAIPMEEALRMASLYPAQVMNITDDYGSIEVGKKANMILLNEELGLVSCSYRD
jgi:N-acetylglucosamine-6-phosphate deacetylase